MAGRSQNINFWDEIEPMFNQMQNPVIFCAGDLGAGSWSSDFMYDKYDNITFIATGMGEGVGDNYIIINVEEDKNISYNLICLNTVEDNCFGDLESYDIESWIKPNTSNNCVIHPNPASNFFKVLLDKSSNFTIQVFAIDGQLVFESKAFNTNEYVVDCSYFIPGLYIVKILDNKSQTILKVSVN